MRELALLATVLAAGCAAQTGNPGPGETTDLPSCARSECTDPAPGMPNWECEDGRTGGPVCKRQKNGRCGWTVVQCDAAAPEADAGMARSLQIAAQVIVRRPYHCGGARTNPKDPAYSERPFDGTLLFRPGRVNRATPPVAEATVTSGRLRVVLDAGTWCVVTEAKREPIEPDPDEKYPRDPACLEKWFARCDKLLMHTGRTATEWVLHEGCFSPCYSGPPPP